ncbi:hypothetical protein PULV_a1011 [Pseudoalteromonas ulvae UL12]|nr:hypothetical protein [Pseudoalteromonas ulvae UL12]
MRLSTKQRLNPIKRFFRFFYTILDISPSGMLALRQDFKHFIANILSVD